jgi:pyruvyl transferase EpsO
MTESVSASSHLSPAVAASGTADAHAALLDALAQRLADVLGPLVPADQPVALLDAPLTPNVGDNMIWAGTMAYLARRGVRPCYTCTNRTFAPDTLARRIRRGTILLSGGGNFGDLYPDHQEFREEIATRFPNHRIVQLPQSIHFESDAALAASRHVLERHRDFTLLVRDQASFDVARAQFRGPKILCPDMSFALGRLERPAEPIHDIVWLGREDKEAREPLAPMPGNVARFDWMTDDLSPRIALYRRLMPMAAHRPWLRSLLTGVLSHEGDVVACASVARGCRLLSQGRVVVTSRLHGHLLCMLLGIRHVVLDNTYGKVHGAFDTWTHGSPLVQLADSQSEALARATALVAAER